MFLDTPRPMLLGRGTHTPPLPSTEFDRETKSSITYNIKFSVAVSRGARVYPPTTLRLSDLILSNSKSLHVELRCGNFAQPNSQACHAQPVGDENNDLIQRKQLSQAPF